MILLITTLLGEHKQPAVIHAQRIISVFLVINNYLVLKRCKTQLNEVCEWQLTVEPSLRGEGVKQDP